MFISHSKIRNDLTVCNKAVQVRYKGVPILFGCVRFPSLSFELSLHTPYLVNFKYNQLSRQYNFKKANFAGLYQAISTADWGFLDSVNNVGVACSLFYGYIYFLFDRFRPGSVKSDYTDS